MENAHARVSVCKGAYSREHTRVHAHTAEEVMADSLMIGGPLGRGAREEEEPSWGPFRCEQGPVVLSV